MKQTEIGLIPDDWEVKSLGDISDNCSYGVGAEAIAFNGKDRYIRITDIDDTSNKYVPQPLTSPSFFSSKDIVNENDILFARTGASVGKTYIYDKKDEKLIFAGFLMRLNIRNANSKFIFYNTITQRYKNWITSESMRTGQPGLNLEQLKSYLVAFPPLEEQQRIAKALSDVDALISTTEKLIQKKKNIKQGTMQNLLTGKKRLPGFAKSNKTKITELGEIPEDWEVKNLGGYTTLITKGTTPTSIGDNFSDSGIKFIKIESLTSNFKIDLSKIAYISESTHKKLYRSELKQNDLLISIAGALGKTAIVESNVLPANTNQALAIIRLADNSSLNVHFILYWINSKIIQAMIKDMSVTGAQPNISLKNVNDLPIIIPSKEEQTAIADVLFSMDKEIETLNTKLEKYRNIKTAMMQQLLTGKIRLK